MTYEELDERGEALAQIAEQIALRAGRNIDLWSAAAALAEIEGLDLDAARIGYVARRARWILEEIEAAA